MKKFTYSISPEIFARNPGYVRGLIIAENIDNSIASPESLRLLREAEVAIKDSMSLEALLASPKIDAWKKAFKAFGATSEFRAAHEAMARRAVQGKLLPDINTAVNIGNAISLRHLLPVGVHPLDQIVNDIHLRLACGDEQFVAFGTDKTENPKLGEIILAEGNNVLTRCWVWRQAKISVTLPGTRSIVVNIDGLPPSTPDDILGVMEEAANLIQKLGGGEIRRYLLSEDKPQIST